MVEQFENLVAFATDTVYNYKILDNNRKLKERDGIDMTESEKAILALLKRVVKEYRLEEIVDYDDYDNDIYGDV